MHSRTVGPPVPRKGILQELRIGSGSGSGSGIGTGTGTGTGTG